MEEWMDFFQMMGLSFENNVMFTWTNNYVELFCFVYIWSCIINHANINIMSIQSSI